MSSVPGGGWYAELHVFPLHPIQPKEKQLALPNKGKFTGHDRHVPCFLSGSQKEWIRLSHAILNHHPLTEKKEAMLVLHDIHIQDSNSYNYETSVLSYRVLLLNSVKKENTNNANNNNNILDNISNLCHLTNNKRAIRISPEDMVAGSNEERKRSYFEVTRAFMSKFRSTCLAERPIM